MLDDRVLLRGYRKKAVERGSMFTLQRTIEAVADYLESLH